jgi:hypothetical protein
LTSFLLVSALVGATLIVTSSTLLRPVRRLYPPLLHCSQCSGFWVGALAGATGLVSVGCGRALGALVVGCATSFLSQVADGVLSKLLGPPEE